MENQYFSTSEMETSEVKTSEMETSDVTQKITLENFKKFTNKFTDVVEDEFQVMGNSGDEITVIGFKIYLNNDESIAIEFSQYPRGFEISMFEYNDDRTNSFVNLRLIKSISELRNWIKENTEYSFKDGNK